MFGSHLSIAGSMVNALDEAIRLKLECVQVFTKNQQQWKVPPLDPAVVAKWTTRVAELGWQDRTVSHASYLINLASPDDTLWRRSIDLMAEEILRCQILGIPFLVHHPGAFTTSTREQGLARIAAGYKELFERTGACTVISCLENTVGGGSNLGREFEELATLRDMIIEKTRRPERVGICFDTCHAHAGGYDLSSKAGAERAIQAFGDTVGLECIRVLHLNDSKGKHDSRLDRHEHIGQGTIGDAGFKVFVNHAHFAAIPKILETPKGKDDAGEDLDTVNLRRLWSMRTKSPIKQPERGMAQRKRPAPRR